MDMSNTDITSQIIEIIQPFFVEDQVHDPNNLSVSPIIPNDLVEPPLNNDILNDLIEQPSNNDSQDIPKFELKRRPGLYGMSGGITKELITSLLNSGSVPPSLVAALGGLSSSSFMMPPAVEESFDPIGENTLYCDQCSFHTNDQICMMDHTLIYHDGAFNEYACDRCNAYFQSMTDLDEHIAISHPKKTIKREKNENVAKTNENIKIEEPPEAELDYDDEDEVSYEENEMPSASKSIYIKKQISEADSPSQSDIPSKPILPNIKISSGIFGTPQPVVEQYESDDEPPQPIQTPEEIAKQNLHKWSSSSGKFQCQICHLKFRSQNHLGEHFMLNHQTYEEQLELDKHINTTSFPGFEILADIEYCSFPENEQYYGKQCEICCEEYLIGHNKRIKIINSSYLDEYTGETLYPTVTECCQDNHTCHKCLSGYLNESYLNGMLCCPFCQQDKTRYGLKYLSIVDIQCDKQTWQRWWSEKDRLDILAFTNRIN